MNEDIEKESQGLAHILLFHALEHNDKRGIDVLSTPIFARIRISPEKISNSYVANKKSPRRGETKLRKNEMKLRKNEMKLRKNEIISPKNFSTPHWIIRDPY